MAEGEIKFTARVDTSKMAGDLSRGVKSAQEKLKDDMPDVDPAGLARIRADELRRRVQARRTDPDQIRKRAQEARAAFWEANPPPKIKPAKLKPGGGSGGGPSGLSQGISSLGTLGVPGLSTLTRASVAGPIGIAIAAVAATIIALNHAIQKMMEAVRAAASLYAKQLRSGGLGADFVSRRSVLARVMGVGEDEVMQYGNAVAYLNNKVAFASKTFAETNPVLTGVAYHVGVMNENLAAMWSKIAVEAAPSIIRLADSISYLSEKVAKNSKFLWGMMMASINQITFGNKVSDSDKAPGVNTNIDRMPASAWEKMGLVIGNSQGQNHLMTIAASTKPMPDLLKEIIYVLQGGKGVARSGTPVFAPAFPQP